MKNNNAQELLKQKACALIESEHKRIASTIFEELSNERYQSTVNHLRQRKAEIEKELISAKKRVENGKKAGRSTKTWEEKVSTLSGELTKVSNEWENLRKETPTISLLKHAKNLGFSAKDVHVSGVSMEHPSGGSLEVFGNNIIHYPKKSEQGDAHFNTSKQPNAHELMANHLTKTYGAVKESVETLSEAIPYPEKSKHLKAYKVVTPKDDPNYDKEWTLEHPEGHKLVWNRTANTFTHHTSGQSKPKTGNMRGDLHPHLMKVHNKFDDQVKEYMQNYHDFSGQMKLQHLMGALEYKTKKSDYSGDREADAIRYKAMHTALMKLTKKDRGVR